MIKKLKKSFKYSFNGIKATFQREQSFQMEIIALPFLIVLVMIFPVTHLRKLIMIASYLLIPCFELLNSAIEKLADRITTKHDTAIEFVKDAASASILLGFVLVAIVWIGCLWF